ncbi:STAS/SEC14 domain-containing protein [Celeribacter baekdonensis]|uniref:SpoIIAA-like n=1 Tax=Celeribacter baekdonensis TaxID=875171 RepID=A0A2R4M185_9RHOB|nr:STAS/SEC14 domain-containing protein [Celeribacter baekdonensis]AVW90859.1 hypothetical protein DA792_06990 [Celeribacter baekdonensis]
MIHIDTLNDKALALTIEGKISKEDIVSAEAALAPMLERPAPYGLMVDLIGFTDVTAGALIEDVRYEVSLIRRWSDFHHMSIVTDRNWVGTWVGMIQPLFPKIEIKMFGPDQRAEARAFAASVDSTPAA